MEQFEGEFVLQEKQLLHFSSFSIVVDFQRKEFAPLRANSLLHYFIIILIAEPLLEGVSSSGKQIGNHKPCPFFLKKWWKKTMAVCTYTLTDKTTIFPRI